MFNNSGYSLADIAAATNGGYDRGGFGGFGGDGAWLLFFFIIILAGGWGNGWNNGNVYYQPWNTTNSDGTLYGPRGEFDLTGDYAQSDWGVYNPISNGGNQLNQWRTLTKQEWEYVLNTRSTTSGVRYAFAKVNGVNGMILLPDDWNTSYYSLNNTNSSVSNPNYSNNTITASQWSSLEQYGLVFLPAAGYRDGISVSQSLYDGYYWSASVFLSTMWGASTYDAYYMSFHPSQSVYMPECYRSSGFSVRLVQNVD